MSVCGTDAGATAHWRRREPVCDACKEARAVSKRWRERQGRLSDEAAEIDRWWKQTEPIVRDTTANDGWRRRAACLGMDVNLFVPKKEDAASAALKVRPICAGCEVREECLEWALNIESQEGFAGGLSYRQRRDLRMTRQRAEGAA